MGILLSILSGLGIAAVFYAGAEYEHLTGWKWAAASLAVTVTVRKLFPLSFIFVLPAQFGLFLVMVWAHNRRKAELEQDRSDARQADMRRRQEQLRQARERGPDPLAAARETEREAREAAALKERQERVRLAREARKREEGEAPEGSGESLQPLE